MTEKRTEKTVLITRPADQADSLRIPLLKRGAKVLFQPVIEIIPVAKEKVSANLTRSDFDRLIFSSANGVRYFFEFLTACRSINIFANDLFQRIENKQIGLAAMGSGTARELEKFGVQADLVPVDFRAEGMIDSLKTEGPAGRKYLSIRGSRGRSVLRDQMMELGALVSELSVYESRDLTEPDPEIQTLLATGKIDAVTVTSSAIAESLVQMFGALLNKTKLFSISPLTSSALRKNGFEPSGEAVRATMEDLIDRIISNF